MRILFSNIFVWFTNIFNYKKINSDEIDNEKDNKINEPHILHLYFKD